MTLTGQQQVTQATETRETWWTRFVDYLLFTISNAIYSGAPLFFWVRPRWSVSQMPSQAGKVVLITGANNGIGYESARALYRAGAKVYLACRSKDKAWAAIERIKEEDHVDSKSGELVFLQLDLADLHSVKKAADEFLSQESKLDVLMANAGIMATAEGQHTKQGYTLQTGTNVLGHQALISLLLPLLLSTSRTTPQDPARVILLSSAGHALAPKHGIDYKSLVADPETLAAIQARAGHNPNRDQATLGGSDGKRGRELERAKRGKHELDRMTEYAQAKWGDLALSKYLESVYGPNRVEGLSARRSGSGELLNFSVHPVATGLADHIPVFKFIATYIVYLFFTKQLPFVRWPDIGAGNQLWAATMPATQARELSGSYIVPFQRVGRARPDSLKVANQVRLWDWCEEQVKRHI